MFKAILRQLFIRWLNERALVIPSAKRKEIARKLKVDEAVVLEIEEAIRKIIIEEVTR